MQHLCREKTLPRNDQRSRARGWIRRNTTIGPVLNIHVCYHEDRYSTESQVRSLFQDRTATWVRIVNGVEKYVTETTETIEDEEHRASEKPFAKARRMTLTVTLTPVSVPLRERKVAGRHPGSYDHECYVISKTMVRLLRHDQNIPRETGGAVKFEDIVEEFNKTKKKKFEGASQWSLKDWISILAREGGAKKTVSMLFEPKLSQTHFVFQSNPGTFWRYCY